MLQVDGTNGRARVHAEFMLEENERNSREQTTKLKGLLLAEDNRNEVSFIR